MITVAAAALDVPRLSVTLVEDATEQGITKSLVAINMLTDWLDDGEPNYDPAFDWSAPEGQAKLPTHHEAVAVGMGKFICSANILPIPTADHACAPPTLVTIFFCKSWWG